MIGCPTLVVIGTGQLARAVCYSLAVSHPADLRVVVVGRRAAAAAELCYVAAARAAAGGRVDTAAGGQGAPGRGVTVRFEPAAAGTRSFADVLGAASPAGVLVCASSQSPWERLTAPSAWTALVERAGFGITLPLQAELALVAGAAAPADAWLVNACFPDAVNPVLAASGTPALCGVGNVGLLAASLQSALDLPDQSRLRVLGHHVHLHRPASPQDEALAWCDGEPVPEVGKLLAGQRAAARPELNHVTGLTAALLMSALLTGATLDTSLPGPLGLPGGYPVRVRGTRLELRLPPGLAVADAVARNQRWALGDGVLVENGRVAFSAAARAELGAVAPGLAGGFGLADLQAATRDLHATRERLRGEPCPQ